MCGIAGFVNREGKAADRGIVDRMTASLAHRGPDGDGLHVSGPVALGHRRLSIIDVSGGAQPMCNEDGTVWVTYNGELYNEPEIRRELKAKGHVYRNESDTESLVHLYEEEGIDFVKRLNGMFALALWDQPRGRLVLARDRMGQKPLFHARLSDGGLAFGSEPKAFFSIPTWPGPRSRRSGALPLLRVHSGPAFDLERDLQASSLVGTGLGNRLGQVRRYWESPLPDRKRPANHSPKPRRTFWTEFREAVGAAPPVGCSSRRVPVGRR